MPRITVAFIQSSVFPYQFKFKLGHGLTLFYLDSFPKLKAVSTLRTCVAVSTIIVSSNQPTAISKYHIDPADCTERNQVVAVLYNKDYSRNFETTDPDVNELQRMLSPVFFT